MPRVSRQEGKTVLRQRIDIGVMLGTMSTGEIVAQRAQQIASDKGVVDTGRLARSIHRGPPQRKELYVWVCNIGTNVEYAMAQYRKKIEIVAGAYNPDTKSPNPKKALSFKWAAGPDPHPALTTEGPYAGHYTFRSVMHPGVRPRPYLRPALQSVMEDGTMRTLILRGILGQVKK